MDWGIVAGRMEAVGVRLRSARDSGDPQDDQLRDVLPPASSEADNPLGREPQPVTASVWRALPIAQVIDGLRSEAERTRAELFPGHPGLRAWRRRRDRGTGSLEEVAAIYRAAWEAGDRRPTLAVAKALVVEHSTAAKRVQRARAAGLLPPTSRGRPTAHQQEDGK